MHMANLAFEHPSEFRYTSLQCFLLPRLPCSLDGTHISMASVEENGKIGVINILHHLYHFRGLIKKKPRLEFPHQFDSLFLCETRAGTPQADNSFPSCNAIHAGHAIRSIYRIDANCR